MNCALILLSMGMIGLYLGFSSALGLFIWYARRRSTGRISWLVPAVYALLIYLPISLYLARFFAWSMQLRLGVLAAGGLLWVTIALLFPRLPPPLRSPLFGRQYLSLTMLIVASWCLTYWLRDQEPSLLVLGLAACTASLSALRDALPKYEMPA